jgi:hypothetical protein
MDWSDDDTDWSFEEERPMTTRSHKKSAPTQVPPLAPTQLPAVEPQDSEYQTAVLEKLDEIIVCLKDLLDHLRGN